MKPAYIIDILRTPIGKYGGTLASVRPDDLAAHVIKKLMERNPTIPINEIEDVIFGAANQAGEDNRNVARMALLLAGLPTSVGGVTVNRLCASGLQAIMDAARSIAHEDGDFYVTGGVESMSRAPFVMPKAEEGFSRKVEIYDTTLGWRFVNSKLSKLYHPYSMGETAENVAEQWKISREAQDGFALASQQKYGQANQANKFKEELVAVSISKGKEVIEFNKDEFPRETSLEKLASLKPAFKENGSVTAGNSSGINDGAAACVMASEAAITKHHLKPLARVVSVAVAGVDPAYMGLGPVPAVQKALKRAGLKISDIGLVELNEAFATHLVCALHLLTGRAVYR
ncbi:MAG: acetyl-CoA C-acyltransferase [Cytophagales bacterium]